MYEDDHSDSITKDAENLEEKGTIRKQSVAKVNIITDHSDREMDESVIDHSSFIDVLNHEKEKRRKFFANVDTIQNLKTISFYR